MAKKTIARKTKADVAGVAKAGATQARNITGEALGAAAAAAVEVVLQRIAEALGAGAGQVASAKSAPAKLRGVVTKAIADTSTGTRRRKKRPAKAGAAKRTSGTKARAKTQTRKRTKR